MHEFIQAMQLMKDKCQILVFLIKSLSQNSTHSNSKHNPTSTYQVHLCQAVHWTELSQDALGWPSISSVSVSVCHCHDIDPDTPGQACWVAQQQK